MLPRPRSQVVTGSAKYVPGFENMRASEKALLD